MSVFSWHADTPSGNAPPTGTPHGGTPSFRVPQLRWLPSALSRTPTANTLPAISSTLRPRERQHHYVPAPTTTTVDTTAETPRTSDSVNSSSGPSPREAAATDAPGDADYEPTPRGDDNAASEEEQQQLRRSGGADARITAGEAAAADGEADTTRKHGKRLTTLEEVSLFNICNRHAATFGERNKLCEWWMTVTDDFTREQGHPYSWHSVRRKVEVVTKQRIKFLADQKEKGGEDRSNQQWREAVDAWIPTWERFEAAEAKRIEERDARRGRKRKDRSWEFAKPWENTAETWRTSTSSSLVTDYNNRPRPVGPPATASSAAPPAPPAPASPAIRMPPGYDSIFPSQTPRTPLAGINDAAASAGNYSAQSYRSTPPAALAADPSVTSAVLETLSKLNKHLDAVASNPRSSPVVAVLASSSAESPSRPEISPTRTETTAGNGDAATTAAAANAPSFSTLEKLKEEIREELRSEFRRELEKDRSVLEEKLDSVQRTQEMILEMLRQEPA